MIELKAILGAVLSSVAHARRIADEETAAIAEYYRANPLLEGMSVPRMRIPQVEMDIPLVIEGLRDATRGMVQETATIVQAILAQVQKTAQLEGLVIPSTVTQAFADEMKSALELCKESCGESERSRELVVRAVEVAWTRVIERCGSGLQLSSEQNHRMTNDLRLKAAEVALKKAGCPSSLFATIVTSEIKEKSCGTSVARLHITLNEQGLEWSLWEKANGGQGRKLTPE